MASSEKGVTVSEALKSLDNLETAIRSTLTMKKELKETSQKALKMLSEFVEASTALLFKNKEQEKEIEELKVKVENVGMRSTYANVVTSKNENINKVDPTKADCVTKNVITIFHTDKTVKSEVTKQIIKTAINPAELKIGVSKVKNIGGGGVLIECLSENECKLLQGEIMKKFKELEVKIPTKKNPNMIIYNVPNDVSDEDLLKTITAQNPE